MSVKRLTPLAALEAFFEESLSPLALLDRDFNFIRVNRAYARADDRGPDEFPGRNHFELYPDPENEAIFREVVRTKQTYLAHARPFVYPHHPERGVTYWDWTLIPLLNPSGNVEYLAFALMDVTVHRRAVIELKAEHEQLETVVRERTDAFDRLRSTANELQRSYNQIQRLARHQQTVREDERTAVARQIHDQLGQALTALKLDIAWLEQQITKRENRGSDRGWREDPCDVTDLRSRIGSMNRLIDDTITTVRRIATELRPAILDSLGLVAAIEWMTHDYLGRTGIAWEFTSDTDDLSLGRDCSTAIFRILQEALTNVIRHAAASRVWIRLTAKPHRLKLTIDDDGIGIDRRIAAAGDSLGLMGMRERALVFGGDIVIRRREGAGTRVVVTIPCPCPHPRCNKPGTRHSKSGSRQEGTSLP